MLPGCCICELVWVGILLLKANNKQTKNTTGDDYIYIYSHLVRGTGHIHTAGSSIFGWSNRNL